MKRIILLLFALLSALPAEIAAQKKPMDENVFDAWKRVNRAWVSDDGSIVSYQIDPAVGDGKLYIRYMETGDEKVIDRGNDAALFGGQKWLRYSVAAPYAETRQVPGGGNAPRQNQTKRQTYIMDLATGDTINITDRERPVLVKDRPMIAFKMNAPAPAPEPYREEAQPDSTAVNIDSTTVAPPAPQPGGPARRGGGQILCVVDLALKDTARLVDVDRYVISGDGQKVIYTVRRDSITSLHMWNAGDSLRIDDFGKGVFGLLSFDAENGDKIAYSYAADTSVCKDHELFVVDLAELVPRRVGDIPEGMVVDHQGENRVNFSKKGRYLTYDITYPYKEPVKDTVPQNEKFTFELWSHQDTIMFPVQNVQRARLSTDRSQMIYDTRRGISRRLTYDADMFTTVNLTPWVDDSDLILMSNNAKYRRRESWDTNVPSDYYAFRLGTGEKKQILENHLGAVMSSPAGYVYYFDARAKAWFFMDPRTGTKRNLTGKLKENFWNEQNDMPSVSMQYGAAGWLKPAQGDTGPEKLVVYDRYDLWVLDPSGRQAPRRLTDGRKSDRTFRYIRTDRDAQYLDEESSVLLLSSFHNNTKDGGFYSIEIGSNEVPKRLIEGPYKYSFGGKAKKAGRILWMRERFDEYPDLRTSSDITFFDDQMLSYSNPEMEHYKWGSARLFDWKGRGRKTNNGILYLPEDYNPRKKYPTIIYYYERSSDGIHDFKHAEPSWSIVMIPMYVSNGYVVFVPDIEYKTGHPMQCALEAVTSGAKALIKQGIADPKRIGLQGQSWGGTQTNYIITQTDMFRCASSGAGEANMISGYGYLRMGSGMPRTFQYETGQSRMGATIWENIGGYMDNSALYSLPQVKTPLLIRHSANDEAVSFHQAMQLFNGLRRLGKEVWLLNYPNGGHNMRHWQMKKDFDKRMMQFFDHYLKDAPAPRWMVEGIGVRDQGKDLKLDMVY